MLWKTSVLPVQSQSGEQHILWQPLSVSVKGICLAVFTGRLGFGPMRPTERATGLYGKRNPGAKKKKTTLTVFWRKAQGLYAMVPKLKGNLTLYAAAI